MTSFHHVLFKRHMCVFDPWGLVSIVTHIIFDHKTLSFCALQNSRLPFVRYELSVTAGWMRYKLPAFRLSAWMPILLERGWLECEGDFLLVTSSVDDFVAAVEIVASFDLR